MSSLALLNNAGVVARKLQLVFLPDDYIVPEGMIVSWRMDMHVSSLDPMVGWRGSRWPLEASFYLGDAWGQVCCDRFKEYEVDKNRRVVYGSRNLTITVQGTLAKDVMELRDCIMNLINSGVSWGASNDLNPKPKQRGFLQRFLGK
jgi:hypothetical protein